MNGSEIESAWNEFSPVCRTQWPKLTDAHLKTISGKRDGLSQALREVCGFSEEQAERSISAFELDCRKPGAVK